MVGINIWKKILTSLKPSIRAASIISTGKALAFCRNIMIINGVEMIGRIKPTAVFKSPAFENILNKEPSLQPAEPS